MDPRRCSCGLAFHTHVGKQEVERNATVKGVARTRPCARAGGAPWGRTGQDQMIPGCVGQYTTHTNLCAPTLCTHLHVLFMHPLHVPPYWMGQDMTSRPSWLRYHARKKSFNRTLALQGLCTNGGQNVRQGNFCH